MEAASKTINQFFHNPEAKVKSIIKFLLTAFFLLLTGVSDGRERYFNKEMFQNDGWFEITMPKHDMGNIFSPSLCEKRLAFYEDKSAFYQVANQDNSISAGDKLAVVIFEPIGEATPQKFKDMLEEQGAKFFALFDSYSDLKKMPAVDRNKKEILWKNSKDDLGVPLGSCFFNGERGDWGVYSNLDGLDLSGVRAAMVFIER